MILINILKYANAALRKFHLPTINTLKLEQKYKLNQIRKSVPNSLAKIKAAHDWNPTELLRDSTPIYVMWWTGEKSMPSIVSICYKNLCLNARSHPITLITKDNIKKLFPSYNSTIKQIVELYDNRKIKIQHLSDMLRTFIISKFDSIWIDATVFVSPNWDANLTGLPYYSGRRTSKFSNSGASVTKGEWTSYFVASVKGNPMIQFLYDGLLECFMRRGQIKEYYTMDYLFTIIKKNPQIYKMIDSVPKIDANLFALENEMSNSFDKHHFESFLKQAPFYKLNHRINYNEYDKTGNLTLFGYLSKSLL